MMKKVLQQALARLALASFLVMPTLSVGAVAANYQHMNYELIINTSAPSHASLLNKNMFSYKTVINRPLLRIPVAKPIESFQPVEQHIPSFFELATLFNDKLQSWSDKLTRTEPSSDNKVAHKPAKKCSFS